MKLWNVLAGAAVVAGSLALGSAASAVTYTYVGSWNVADGPDWTTEPLAYTGQEAAALLFGGTPSEYAISTNGSDPADINFEAIYSVFSCCQADFAQNYTYNNTDPNGNNFPGGLYFNGNYNYPFTGPDSSPASAYVDDNAYGENYAFLINAVPEPATWALMLVGFGGLGAAMRSRRRQVGVAA